MKIKNLILSALIICSFQSIAQEKKTLDNVANDNPAQADFKFVEEEFDFGTITQGESVTHEFKFTNVGTEPLIISKAEGSCGCTVPVFSKEPIMKDQTGSIKVTFNSAGKFGMQDKTITLTSNAARNPMIIHVKGNVVKPAEQPAGEQPKNN
jgi:hypothetical protein